MKSFLLSIVIIVVNISVMNFFDINITDNAKGLGIFIMSIFIPISAIVLFHSSMKELEENE